MTATLTIWKARHANLLLMTAMTDPAASADSAALADSPFTRTRLAIAILAVLAMLAIVSAIFFQAPQLVGATKILTDYDAFHVAGRLALEGRADDAYRLESMFAAQEEFTGKRSFMPWTYPPPFTLFVAMLANLPVGVGFLLFTGLTFAFYLHVVHRIAGRFTPGVLMLMLPTLLLLTRTGQNGFLTGGLIGMFLLAFLQRQAGAGLPLGLMVIKPHLAVGITLMTLAERRWQSVIIAALTVITLLLAATAALGPEVWSGFIDGIAESGTYLRDGYYPLFRMTSLYATAHTLGAGPGMAMVIQAAGALSAIAALLWLWRRGTSGNRLAAAICCASLFISPYNYDYDLTILGLAIAFVLPELAERTRPGEQTALFVLTWIATGYGLGVSITMPENSVVRLGDPESGARSLSLMAPMLLLVIALATLALRRAPLGGPAQHDSDAQVQGRMPAA